MNGSAIDTRPVRGIVHKGVVRLYHDLPEGAFVEVRLLTEAENREDEKNLDDVMEETRPFREAAASLILNFEGEHLGCEHVPG